MTNILYDEYGQRTRVDYGNGTFTEYSYDPARRWLDSIRTMTVKADGVSAARYRRTYTWKNSKTLSV